MAIELTPITGANGITHLLELRCAEARSLVDVLDERFSLEDILAGASVRAVPPEENSSGIASRHSPRKAAA